MSKFVKGEKVRFAPDMGFFYPVSENARMSIESISIITKVKGDTYQIKHFTGFWPEKFLRKLGD